MRINAHFLHRTDTFASEYLAAQLHVSDCVTSFCRHILSNVSRVAARDSGRTVATVQDLFVGLCEDDGVYSMFKTMKGTSYIAH